MDKGIRYLNQNHELHQLNDDGIINLYEFIYSMIIFAYSRLVPLNKNTLLALSGKNIKYMLYKNHFSKIYHYCSSGYLVCNHQDNKPIILTNQYNTLEKFVKTKIISNNNFFILIDDNYKNLNLAKAVLYHKTIKPYFSSQNINFSYIVVFISVLIFLFQDKYPIYFIYIHHIMYFIQSCFKFFVCLHQSNKISLVNSYVLNVYPVYTILIPLYKEVDKLRGILSAISALHYPQSNLDVKVIVEEDDRLILKELSLIKLPNYVHVVIVPYSLPRTKPKALNYAMQYARGKYVTIYDAEDIPDPNQLIIAIQTFNSLPSKYLCLQAKLNFYNVNEKLLTKLFSIEYSMWFSYLLPGLSNLNLPIPLGGTSNHFKAEDLYKLGLWDPYNVTEDADLGIRIYLHGYKSYVIDSITLEEAPNDLVVWINQRSRWIKGFIKTFFVYLKQTMYLKNKISLCDHISIIILLGISTYSFIILPYLVATTLAHKSSTTILTCLSNFNLIISYLYLFIISTLALYKIKKFAFKDLITCLLFPFYFILHSIASYKAIYEVITQPFKWRKTKHNLSKMSPYRKTKFWTRD